MPRIFLNRIGDDTREKLSPLMELSMPHTKAPTSRVRSAKSARAAVAPAVAPPAVGAAPNRALVHALAGRLRQSLDSPDVPLVIVNRMAATRSIYVMVVWDRWRDLTIPRRGRVIEDAFAAAFPNEQAVVRLPMGLTSGEALSQGYLPYKIVPTVRMADKVPAREMKEAMASAGGVLMRVGNDQQLRFATRAQAEAAYRRLVEKINKPIWTLSEETSTSDS